MLPNIPNHVSQNEISLTPGIGSKLHKVTKIPEESRTVRQSKHCEYNTRVAGIAKNKMRTRQSIRQMQYIWKTTEIQQ